MPTNAQVNVARKLKPISNVLKATAMLVAILELYWGGWSMKYLTTR